MRHLRCRVFRRTSPDCGWLPSNQRLGEACGGATDGQTGRYGVFTVSKCESFLLRRLGVSTGRWGGNLGFKAREVGKRPKCRVSWGKEKNPPPASPLFQRLSEQRKWLKMRHLRCRVFWRTSPDCGWLPSNQRLGEACGGATDGQTGRYGVFTVSKCESFLLRRLGVSTGRWGGNLGFKAREVGKRPKCRVSWGKE